MKKYILILFSITLLLFNGCYLFKSPEILIKKDFSGEGIAVLNFYQQGSFYETNIGKLAADKLTDALFIDGKFNVIDRAKVNEAQVKLDIKTTEFLSSDLIQQIGIKLKANYLILGRIQNVTGTDFLSVDSDREIFISFRIISVATSDVIGVSTYSCTYDDNLVKTIEEMMEDIVKKMVGE